MALVNCKKCSKVFQKVLSDHCSDCLIKEEDQFRNLYRLLQNSATHGGISIEELATQSNVSVSEIEQLFQAGKFGTAGACLKYECQTCHIMMGALQRRGRFCINCSEKTAAEAGVQVQSQQNIQKQRESEAQKAAQLKSLKSITNQGRSYSRR